MDTCGDKPRYVRHVYHHDGADRLRHSSDAGKIDHARIGARPHHDHLRLVLMCQPLQFLVVDPLIVFADAIRDDVVQLAGEVERMTVGQVSAMRQVHAEHRVSRLHGGEVDRHVGLRARVRLHVGVLGAEQLFRSRDRQRLGHVHELASAVIATPRVSLGVLVRHHRTRRFEDRAAHEVL